MPNQWVTSGFPTDPPDPEKRNAAPGVGSRNGGNAKEAAELRSNTYHGSQEIQFEDLDAIESLALSALDGAQQWVAWRSDERNGSITKVPYDPTGPGKAKAGDRSTWGTRTQAKARARTLLSAGQAGGIGLQLGEIADDGDRRIGGVDLDSCRDVETGKLKPWARAVVDRFASYAEVSPSRKGVKVFFVYKAADLQALRDAMGKDHSRSWSRGSHHEIALHLGNRYFALTGDALPTGRDLDDLIGTPAILTPVGKANLLWLIHEAGPAFAGDEVRKPEPKGSDGSRSGRALKIAGRVRRMGCDLDTYLRELRKEPDLAAWAKDQRQVQRAWEKAAGDGRSTLDGFALTEDGVALAFASRHKGDLRFDHQRGRWFAWTGSHWRSEDTKLAFNWCRAMCRDIISADPQNAAARGLTRASAASGVERFAQADRAFAVTSDIWDADPFLLGTPGGTVDLRTGELRDAAHGDFITRRTAVAPIALDQFDPDRDCPRWVRFLSEATADDEALIRFLQQWTGYTLTGDTREHALLFIYGPGGNGKSVFLNAVSGLMGDYASVAPMETLMAAKGERHPTDVASLDGPRLVMANETEAGQAWARARVNQLTGGDPITARFMRQDFFTFRPRFKLTIVGNSKPALHNVDDAAKRRFNIVPFEQKPKRPDMGLEGKLRDEWPGILSWALQGCLDWLEGGLCRPAVVTAATADYFADQDVFGQWLDQECEIGRGLAATNADLSDSWRLYASRHGEREDGSSRGFADRLRARGFEAIKNAKGIRGRGFAGLRLKPDMPNLDDDL